MSDFHIYTTDTCKWCVEAKSLLSRLGHRYTEMPLSDRKNREYFDSLGFKTVPQIFVADADSVYHHIGGYYDLRKWLETKDEVPQ